MSFLKGVGLLNLVFELKFLNVFMGREDPIEFYIEFYIVCLFIGLLGFIVLLG
jgi:hypothetical protein